MQNLLEIRNITVAYDQKVVLENASFSLAPNDFVGIIGPNGGGKTTLLKAILGLVVPQSGEVVFSKELKNRGGDVGYLPQINKFDQRFPISVSEVIRSGLAGRDGWIVPSAQERRQRTEQIIADLNIGAIANKAIGDLSGGQMQRAFLGRALISNPKILVLDEPDTYVDSQFESELYQKLVELNKRMAILLVSHDVGTISTHVKSIACVNRHLHYHPSNIISPQQLKSYNCPIQIITHGDVPHTVLGTHSHTHKS